MREKPNQDISFTGRKLTLSTKNDALNFDYALTSNLGRANATAELLGKAATHFEPELGFMPQAIFDLVGMGSNFETLNQYIKKHVEIAEFSIRQGLIYTNYYQ